jgi:cytochrome c biogenesis protein CcmG, thiol:disulfide interchange protein DsbE
MLAGCGAPTARVAPTPSAMPSIAMRRLDASSGSIDEVRGSRPALIAFWATWCDACLAEQDALARLERAAKPRGAMVIGVATGEDIDTVRAFLTKRPLPYAQLADPEFALAQALGVASLPTVMVVDEHGRVTFVGGALDHEALEAFRRVLTKPE